MNLVGTKNVIGVNHEVNSALKSFAVFLDDNGVGPKILSKRHFNPYYIMSIIALIV